MARESKLAGLLRSIGAQMRSALSERLIEHPGELGAGREEIVRQFLRAHLPHRLGVDGGFAIDSLGETSGEMDLLIYDRSFSPTFRTSGGQLLIPCEAVVCAGQVKSSLTSSQDTLAAFDNLGSVTRLARTRTERLGGSEMGFRNHERELDHLDQIFTFLFVTGRSLTAYSMVEVVAENCIMGDREWPNLVFSLDRYIVTYACESGVCPNTHCAKGVSLIDSTQTSADELLLRFFLFVAQAAVITNVWKFSYADHLVQSVSTGGLVYPFSNSPLWADDDEP